MNESDKQELLVAIITDNGCRECGFNETKLFSAVDALVKRKVEEATKQYLNSARAVLPYLKLSGEATYEPSVYRSESELLRYQADMLDLKEKAIRDFKKSIENITNIIY